MSRPKTPDEYLKTMVEALRWWERQAEYSHGSRFNRDACKSWVAHYRKEIALHREHEQQQRRDMVVETEQPKGER